MPRYYDPYKELNEYQPPSESQISKWAISGFMAAGAIGLGLKIKGPVGRILEKIEQNKVMRATQENFIKDRRRVHIHDFITKIPTGITARHGQERLFTPARIPNMEELQFQTDVLHEKVGLRGRGMDMARATEKEIENILSGRKWIKGIDVIEESILTGHRVEKIAAEVQLAQIRHRLLMQHLGSDARYLEAGPTFDIFEVREGQEFINYQGIANVHEYLLENDPIYSKKYARQIDDYKRLLARTAAAHVHSNPNVGQFDSEMDDRKLPKSYGGVKDLEKNFSHISVTPNEQIRLYSGQSKELITNEMLGKTLNEITSNKSKIRKTNLTKYGPAVSRLIKSLERLRVLHPDEISETAIEELGYNKAFGEAASYLNVIIKRRIPGKQDYAIEIPIPIVQDNIVPALQTSARPYINANFAADFTSNKPVVDATEAMMNLVSSRLNSVFSHEIVEAPNPKAVEDKLRYSVQTFMDQLSPVSYEMRDYFQTQGIRIGLVEQLMNSRSSETTRRRLSAGVKSLGMLKKVAKDSDKYDILVLDLETINPVLSSPGKTPYDFNTDIWQAGFTYSTGKGEMIQADQIISDHILRSIPELRENTTAAQLRSKMNSNTEAAKALREYGTFAKRTLTKLNPRESPADEAEALIQFRNYVKRHATPASLGRDIDRRKPRSKEDFAKIIGNMVRFFENKSARNGKQLVLLDANGTFFDRALLNLLADGYNWLERPAIDIQAIDYALTMGHYDADSRSLNAMLSRAMEGAGLVRHNEIVDFENMAEETINRLTSGPNAVLRMHPAKKQKKVIDWLRNKFGEHTMQAHGAGLDTVGTLALFQLFKNNRYVLDQNRLNSLEQLVKDIDTFSIKEAFERAFSMEGWMVPGTGGLSFSSSLMSAGKMFKGQGSLLHLGLFSPLFIENPLTKSPQQVFRNIWIKKNSVVNPLTRDFRFRNPLSSPYTIKAEEWMHKRADWIGNQLAHQVQFNTIYTLGSPGGKLSGELIVTRDSMDLSAYDVKLVPFDEIADQLDDGPLADKILQFKREVDQLAKKKSQQMHVNRRHQGGQVTSDIWWEASQEIRAKWERNNVKLPHIDPHTQISSLVNEGGTMRKVKSAMGGEILGFATSSEVRSSNNNGPMKLLVALGTTTDLTNGLDKLAFNHYMSKSVATIVKDIASGQAWGPGARLGPIEAQMNFDFLDKGYWGSLKYSMLNKAIGLAYARTKSNSGFTPEEQARANASLKKIVSKLNESFPAKMDGDGIIRWGPTSQETSLSTALKTVANKLTIEDILEMLQTVGHEATWDMQTFNLWYGYHGNGDIKIARKNLDARMKQLIDGLGSQSKEIVENTEQQRLITSMRTLIQHYDPLTIIEQKLRKRNALKGGSIEKHWQLIGDRERNELLSEVPIFMQMVPTNTGMREGMFAFAQSFTPYGLQGNEVKVNHRVKFQAGYFQQFVFGDHLTETTKKALLSGLNWRNDPRSASVIKNYLKLYDAATNKRVSELYTKHALSFEDIQQLTSREQTLKVIEKHLQQVKQSYGVLGIERVDKSVKAGLQKLGALTDIIESEYDKDRAIGKMTDPESVLQYLRERYNWTTVDEITNVWAKLAQQKGGAFYIPLRNVKKGGEKVPLPEKPFTFILEDVMRSITETPGRNRPKVDTDRFVDALVRQSRASLGKNFPKEEKLFNIELIQSHRDPGMIGKHVVTMNGMFLPTGETIGDFFQREAGQYGRYSELAQVMFNMGIAYKNYIDEAIEARKMGIEGTLQKHESTLAKHWLNMMMYTFSYDKNNPAFNAMQFSYPGVQPLYLPIDNALEQAKSILDNMSDAKHAPLVEKYGPKKLRKVLTNLTNANVNRVYVTTEMFDQMVEQGQRAIRPGRHGMLQQIPLAKMIAEADEGVRQAIEEARLGENSLPGGIFTRNPIGPNGLFGAMSAELAMVPTDIANAIGMKNEVIYAPAVFGSLIKADSDRDHAVYMQLGFSTIDHLNQLRAEQRKATENFMNMEQTRRIFENFNDSYFHTGIVANENTGKYETRLATVVTDRSDPEYGHFRFSDPVEVGKVKHLGLSSLASLTNEKTVMQMLYGAAPDRAIENYLSTISLVSASKRVIPLITNTVRERISDLYKANSDRGGIKRIAYELVGDLETGLSSLMQSSIKLGKHASGLESAHDMISLWRTLNNPGSMSIEQWDALKGNLRKVWDSDIQAERAELALEAAMGKSNAIKQISRLDPTLRRLNEYQSSIVMGRHMSAPEVIDYINQIHDRPNQRLTMHAATATRALQAGGYMDPQIGKVVDSGRARTLMRAAIETNFELARATKRAPSVLGAWFGPERAVKMKGKIAKFGAIGALGFLALNFFNPHQLTNSFNPANGFVNLGTDSGGQVNLWKSELELDRHIPLDSVNAGFEQSARIIPDLDFSDFREKQAEVYSTMFRSKLQNTFGLQLYSNSRANITYTNYTNRTGSFNSYDIARRMRNYEHDRG